MRRYQLVGRFEAGDLAELYRGLADGSEPVVIKLFHTRTTDLAYARVLADTARRLGSVRHPGVASVFELGVVKDRLAVVQQDVGRVSLGQALTRLNTKEVLLAPGLAVAMVIELLDALGLAHGAGVFHGALTPGNIVLSPDGRPAISDFGALEALVASPALMKLFGARGRTSYRAPEAARGGAATAEGDLYSIGAIAYELLTLKEASTGAENVSTRRGAMLPPSRVDRRLNARLDPIILRALDQSPGRRYRSAADFAQALRDFLSANGGLPAKDEARRFVTTLFPAEVSLEHKGPVPFSEVFTLTEISGAELEPLADRSLALTPHEAPLPEGRDGVTTQNTTLPIGGAPDSTDVLVTAPESGPDGRPTLGESRELPSWVAPEAASPAVRAGQQKFDGEAGQRALERRVKVIEDFQAVGKSAPGPGDSGPVPVLPRQAFSLPTSEIPQVPVAPTEQKEFIPFEPGPMRAITEEGLIAAQASKRRQLMFAALGVAALGAVAFFVVAAKATGWGLPRFDTRPPRVAERPAPPPRVEKPEVKPPPVPERVDPPQPREACYGGPPRKKAAFLTVSTSRQVVVRIDGERWCQAGLSRIPVEPGKRKITVTDARAHEPFEASQRFEAGRETKVVPVFHTR